MIINLLTIRLCRFQNHTAMSDLNSLNTFLLLVVIPSKFEPVFIHDLSDSTFQIIFDALWTSMNVSSKHPIAWKDSSPAPSWWFYFHCKIEQTSSPGILCIVCHQVLFHPSEHGTSLVKKHSLGKAHIGKLNKLAESEVAKSASSTVDETAWAILKS